MFEFEGTMLLGADVVALQLAASLVEAIDELQLGGGATLTEDVGGDAVLQELSSDKGDEWIASLLSGTSSDAIAAASIGLSGIELLDPQAVEGEEEEQEIVITGTRSTKGRAYNGEGDSGGSTGSGGTGGSTAGSPAQPVEEHTQDCGTDDGAAVQVAKHVKGELPAGVSGPEDPVTTATGNDWTKVEFGTMIVKNPDGSFGALNNMIYSNDLPGDIQIHYSSSELVQGFWHSHAGADQSSDKRLIDRYPSIDDWNMLERIAAGSGAVSDPSLWIMDSYGVTREFKYSERDYFKGLLNDDTKMVNGEGLDGRERSASCG